jgi:hypothetical protein
MIERIAVVERAATLGVDELAPDVQPRVDAGLGLRAHPCSFPGAFRRRLRAQPPVGGAGLGLSVKMIAKRLGVCLLAGAAQAP